MRPEATYGRFAAFLTSADHGLPGDWGVVYNNRQNLPLPEGASGDRELTGPSSKAEMKPARPQPESSATPAAPGQVPPAPVESRQERLARIKREIEAGTYETADKLEAAIEKMLGVLAD